MTLDTTYIEITNTNKSVKHWSSYSYIVYSVKGGNCREIRQTLIVSLSGFYQLCVL